jgi:hypothetical protein
MNDLISRQAAIDATAETVFVEYEENADKEESIIRQTKAAIRDKIKALPPVQPNHNAEVSKMVDDLISRQAVIEAVLDRMDIEKHGRNAKPEEVVWALENLPPVQPKRGKWIERNPLNSDKCRLIECDQCGKSYIVGFNVPYEHWIDNRNYCEKCGADMRGETE